MEVQKFCVYNQTRDTLLGLDVAAVDAATEALMRQMEYQAVRANTGLWMTPYLGFPLSPGVANLDLICLDRNYGVIAVSEGISSADMLPDRFAASALALPAHTLKLSRTEVGDQLLICTPDEFGLRFPHLSLSRSSSSRHRVVSEPVQEARMSAQIDHASISPRHSAPVELMPGRHSFDESFDPDASERVTLKTRLLRWLVSDRRNHKRVATPRLIAYRWTGGNPYAHHIGDISESGLYLVTEERWIPGTKILITLQRTDTEGDKPEDAIAVETSVVRWGSDGEGLMFVCAHNAGGFGQVWPESTANRRTIKKFLERVADEDDAKVA
ncbi:MAG TPA: PilZ domain-containing protein [Terracidiphilus sp.]